MLPRRSAVDAGGNWRQLDSPLSPSLTVSPFNNGYFLAPTATQLSLKLDDTRF